MTQTIHDTARSLADLCAAKREAYGDSIPKAVAALRAVWPAGIPAEHYYDALVFARVAEKHSRRAQGADPHGENPILDAAGYELSALHYYSTRKVGPEPCASADTAAGKSPAAEPSSTAASAKSSAEKTQTATTNDENALPSAPSSSAPSSPTSPSADVCVLIATAPASGKEAVHASAISNNRFHYPPRCAWCGALLRRLGVTVDVVLGQFYVCAEAPACEEQLRLALRKPALEARP